MADCRRRGGNVTPTKDGPVTGAKRKRDATGEAPGSVNDEADPASAGSEAGSGDKNSGK